MWRLFRGTFRPEESLCSTRLIPKPLFTTEYTERSLRSPTENSEILQCFQERLHSFSVFSGKKSNLPNLPTPIPMPIPREASGDVSRSLLLGSELNPPRNFFLFFSKQRFELRLNPRPRHGEEHPIRFAQPPRKNRAWLASCQALMKCCGFCPYFVKSGAKTAAVKKGGFWPLKNPLFGGTKTPFFGGRKGGFLIRGRFWEGRGGFS